MEWIPVNRPVKLGSKVLGWDGKNWGLYNVPRPHKELTEDEAQLQWEKMIKVYQLTHYAHPIPPME